MILEVQSKLNKKIESLEVTLNEKTNEQRALIQNYEDKKSNMETHFTRQLGMHKDEILKLQDTTTRLDKELQLVKEEKLSQKKKEAEKLSENLLLSCPEIQRYEL